MYELVSYLNNDSQKINGNFSPMNVDMKLTLKKNIENDYFLTFKN